MTVQRIGVAIGFVTLTVGIVTLVVSVLLPSRAVGQLSDPVCRFTAAYMNRDRGFLGAPCCAECPGSIHTAPFGNMGVVSNVGGSIDGDQFRGWKTHGSQKHWNACRNSYPPPDPQYYNSGGGTEQSSTGSYAYAAVVFDSATLDTLGCSAFDGASFSTSNNYLDIYELDPFPGSPSWVGKLTYPTFSVTRTCSYSSCGPNATAWKNPSGQWGNNDKPSAQARMDLVGEYIPGGSIPNLNSFDSENADSRSEVDVSGEVRTNWHRGSSLTRGRESIRGSAILPSIVSSGSTSASTQVTIRDFNGQPIHGAVIIVLDRTVQGLGLRSWTSDASGRASLRLTHGDREVVAFAPGFGRSRQTVAIEEGRQKQITLMLPRGANVLGRVADASGILVAGARISVEYLQRARATRQLPDRLVHMDWHRGTQESLLESQVRTAGSFEVLDIDPLSTFFVRVSHPAHGTTRAGPFTLLPGETLQEVEIILPR